MSVPLAWHRVMELADAHLRMARNRHLAWGEDEAPEEAVPILLDHGLFTHRIDAKRVLYLNGGIEPVQVDGPNPNPGGDPWDLVIEPGQAKMLFREHLDGVFTPNWATSILSTEESTLRILEGELERIGYRYTDKEGV